jgi:hypothetical protein
LLPFPSAGAGTLPAAGDAVSPLASPTSEPGPLALVLHPTAAQPPAGTVVNGPAVGSVVSDSLAVGGVESTHVSEPDLMRILNALRNAASEKDVARALRGRHGNVSPTQV